MTSYLRSFAGVKQDNDVCGKKWHLIVAQQEILWAGDE